VSVKLFVIGIIDFQRYPSRYCLMQGRYFICSNFKKLQKKKSSKLESQPLNDYYPLRRVHH